MMRHSTLARPSLRLVLAVLALGGAGGASMGQGQGLSGHNSNAPVDYAADHIEVLDKQNRVLLTGNVDITQGNLRMRAARTLVAYTNEGGLKIQRIDATGGVTVTRGEESANGDLATYDFNRQIITLVGNVTLRNGSGVSHAERFVINLNEHQSYAAPAAGGRVTGSFTIPKRTQAGQ